MWNRRARTGLLIACVVVPLWTTAFAQYPAKSVRFVVAQAAGSTTDIVGRLLAHELSSALGQQVVVDNRPGAGGAIGSEIVAKAAPDGHTLLLANISTHGVNPALYAKLPYDAVKDFRPIAMTGSTANLLAVHPSLPVSSMKDFVSFVRARKGQINFASPGNGSSQHLAVELLQSLTGLSLAHVAYRGGSPAMTALIAGEVPVMMPALPLALPHVESGKVRPLAVTSSARVARLPAVPTVAETVPGFEVVSWYGIAAPAGTPNAVVSRLASEIDKIMKAPKLRQSFEANGLDPQTMGPGPFGDYIAAEVKKWAHVARKADIAPQ